MRSDLSKSDSEALDNIMCTEMAPPAYAFSSYAISDLCSFKEVKILEINVEFFLVGIKVQSKVVEEYCWAIMQVARWSGSIMLEFGCQLDCLA
jgi:hypothetical protein